MIIAFMGNDGSGKTTLAKMFEDKLRNLGLDVHYRMEFDYFLLSRIFRLLNKERVNRYRWLFLTKEGRDRKPSYFKAWPYLVWLDLLLEWLWNKLLKRNSVVVMDRYAYDFLMSWEWLGYANARLRWLYTHFPKPDLAFILDVSPLTAHLRKKDSHVYSLHYYKVQRKRYLKLAEILKIKMIDTEKAVEECLKEAFTEFRKNFTNKLSDEDKVLLFYSFPGFDPSMLRELNLCFNWSRLNWSYIVDTAVKCGTENVLCMNLLRHQESQLPRRVFDLIRYVLEKSNERADLLVRTLRIVSRKLGEKEVPFLVMKTIAPFDYGATDVDILVRKEHFERAEEALSFMFNVSKSSRMHKAVTYQVAYQGALLPVDLHYEISWLNHKVIDEMRVFMRKRKILYEGIELSVPSREDELLILSAHSLFQHHYTTLSEFLRIVKLASSDEVDTEYILDSSANYGWQQALRSFLSYLLCRHNFVYGSHYSFGKLNPVGKPYVLGINPVYFHRFQNIPRGSPHQVLDLFLTLYRSVRFKLSGRLAYNTNWLKMGD